MKLKIRNTYRFASLIVCASALIFSSCGGGDGSDDGDKNSANGAASSSDSRHLMPNSVKQATAVFEAKDFFGAMTFEITVKRLSTPEDVLWVAEIERGELTYDTISVKIIDGMIKQTASYADNYVSLDISAKGDKGEVIEIYQLIISFDNTNDETKQRMGTVTCQFSTCKLPQLLEETGFPLSGATIKVNWD